MVAELPSTHVYASLQSSHHERLGMVKIQEDVSRVILVGKREQCWFYPKCTPAQKQWKNDLTDFSILSPVINLCQYFVFTKPCPFSVYNTHQAIKKALCLHNIFFHCIGPWQRQQHNSFHKIPFSPFKSSINLHQCHNIQITFLSLSYQATTYIYLLKHEVSDVKRTQTEVVQTRNPTYPDTCPHHQAGIMMFLILVSSYNINLLLYIPTFCLIHQQ